MTDAHHPHPFRQAPHATLVRLSLPVLISLAAEPITGAVDTAFVARLGAPPLAALGVGATLLSGIFWIFNFLVLTIRAATQIGPEAGAVHQAIRQVWVLTALLLDAFALSGQSLVGYFLGRGDL